MKSCKITVVEHFLYSNKHIKHFKSCLNIKHSYSLLFFLNFKVHEEIGSGTGWLRNVHSEDCKGFPFRGTWEYYDSEWKEDEDLKVTELPTTGK